MAPGYFPYLQRNKSFRTGPDGKRHDNPFTCELACATFVSPHLKLAGGFYISAIWPGPSAICQRTPRWRPFRATPIADLLHPTQSKAAISGCRGTIGNAGAEVECTVSPLGAEYNKPTGGGSLRNTRSFGTSVSLERGGMGDAIAGRWTFDTFLRAPCIFARSPKLGQTTPPSCSREGPTRHASPRPRRGCKQNGPMHLDKSTSRRFFYNNLRSRDRSW